MTTIKLSTFILVFVIASICTSAQQKLTINVKDPIGDVAPTMWGIFFEDINFSADGGIYAELVKNRSFEFRNPLMGWKIKGLDINKGEILIINRKENGSKNPRFLRANLSNDKEIQGVENEGFRGMGIKAGEKYNFYIMAKTQNPAIKINIELLDSDGNVIGKGTIDEPESIWKEYSTSFTASKTVEKAKLRVSFEGNGQIDFDMISLFPQKTWKNRPKGLRADLIELLDNLNPGFVRFPGGCIVEGYTLENRYQWKNTVGPIEDRVLIKSRWMDEFRHRFTPDYFQSYGIGFYEYFLLAEDMDAEPLPILNCGMACQYNSKEVASMDDMEPYIQDALDLIEFANGTENTKWGKLRAEMGHPEPFNLTYLGIGNEQWGSQYIERYKEFHKVLKEEHPEIKIISAAGPTTDERNTYLWKELKKLNADIVDEHYYKPPEWFLENADRYDSFDRNGPKVFAGEYASHVKIENKAPEARNNWWAALTEAAYMTGLERNADIVTMTAYAPLLAHKEAWQWNPDMIWFNNLEATPTPNYMVQQIFAQNKGDKSLKINTNNNPLTGQDSLYASTTIDVDKNQLLVKLVNVATTDKNVTIETQGAKEASNSHITIETLCGEVLEYNEVGGKNNFEIETIKQPYQKTLPEIKLKPQSVNLIKIYLK
ncbi:MAG: alpha-L-arabinofuranosidase [Prolixibacteraceae bacterium]|jgi:alpha-N-arabinofuranosidase|nr:alpha-L-arabinofuranosidase [Prolixibacteraceae bacterium]